MILIGPSVKNHSSIKNELRTNKSTEEPTKQIIDKLGQTSGFRNFPKPLPPGRGKNSDLSSIKRCECTKKDK